MLTGEPRTGADGSSSTGAGRVLRLIREGQAVTRADLARRTGLARSTVAQRVDTLIAHHLVYEAGGRASTGGRPPTVLAFNESAGVVLAADLGATHSRLAVADLSGEPLVEQAYDLDIATGPDAVLTWVLERYQALLAEAGRTNAEVLGVGVGIPAPVASGRGEPVAPPIMPGWDGFSIPRWFAAHYDAPVLVDNDVNIMALGEHWTHWREVEHLLFVKVGTGIGCGIVADRHIHRGAQGAAGDIGHIRIAGHDDVDLPLRQRRLPGGRGRRPRLGATSSPTPGSTPAPAATSSRSCARASRWRSSSCATPAATSARCSRAP